MSFWPFKKAETLVERDYFRGFIDYHSHILPGVDDGSRSLEQSLRMLSRYEELGVREVWLTPHVMEDIPNTPESLRERFAWFSDQYKGNITLKLAAENMLDSLFEDRLEKGQVLPLGDGGEYLLVETSYFNPPMNFHAKLERIKSHGFYPLLAHPERYEYMQMSDYRELKEMKVAFQLNVPSLTGLYGQHVKRKAEALQKAGLYDFSGCDLHSPGMQERMLSVKI